MQVARFIAIFNQSTPFISDDWKNKYGELLHKEHWNKLATNIFCFVFKNEMNHNPRPIFSEEIVADYPSHYQYFEPLKLMIVQSENSSAIQIANLIEITPIQSLLIILGQRKTPATLTDEKGIPPLKEPLLESCFAPYNEQICKATRAREKHISRNEQETFWGKIKGSPKEKEQTTQTLVKKIIEEKTWWNVFTHYKHEVVYEIRITSGQGIRWKLNELTLIGFLEPFLEE